MLSRIRQIKYYCNILNEGEILLLKSQDSYFKNHYSTSPLATLTGFLGSEGEAIIDKQGKIKIFVDTRYHLLVDKQVFSDVEVYKMELGESFFDAIKKTYPKNTVLHLPADISLKTYFQYDKYFDLRKYENKNKYLKNADFNKKSSIFKVSSKIDKTTFLDKINKLKKANRQVSRMAIFNLDEISYLTNLRSYQMAYSSNFRSILYLDFDIKKYILFSDKISKKNQIDGLEYLSLDEFSDYITSIRKDIYYNLDDINLKQFLAMQSPKELKKNCLSVLASIKPAGMIEELNNSFRNLDKAIFNFKNRIKTGLSEYDLSKIFEEEILKSGAKGLSFKTILALEENSASIHYSQADKNKVLKDESIILLDCGGYFKAGLATDITRTFYFGKRPKPIYKKIYTNVLKAFLACYLSSETNAQKLDLMAREILAPLNQDGFYFNHGLGHGIGTSVHQNPPVLSMKSTDIIKPYQVHSIEPGLYGKSISTGVEFGVRIENCVYSDLNFNKISLSKFPFEEVLIDYSLLTKTEKEAVELWQENFK